MPNALPTLPARAFPRTYSENRQIASVGISMLTTAECVTQIGILPEDALFLSMGTDGFPVLIDMDSRKVGVLFYGNYNLSSIFSMYELFSSETQRMKEGREAYRRRAGKPEKTILHSTETRNYEWMALSVEDCLNKPSQTLLSLVDNKVGNKKIVFVEDASILVRHVEHELLSRVAKHPDVLLICNSSAYLPSLHSVFHSMLPVGGGVWTTKSDGEWITCYAPLR